MPKSEETIIAAKLDRGELHVSIQFNGTPESYSVAGVSINTGYNQLIQVSNLFNLLLMINRMWLKWYNKGTYCYLSTFVFQYQVAVGKSSL